MKSNTAILLTTILISCMASPSLAGPSGELAEWMVKQGARYGDDVAGRSAKQLSVELEQYSARVGNETVEQLVKKGGPGAVKLVRGMGEIAPDAIRIVAKHGEPGKLLLEQGAKPAVQAFRQFGDDGVRVLIKQGPSKGTQLLVAYGRPLAQSADQLSATSMSHLRHWAPQVDAAAPEVRQAFSAKLAAGGDDFVVWVSKRWKELAVAGGLSVGTITAYKVGDGIADAIPDPVANPVGWIVWWLPLLIIVAIVAGTWLIRHAMGDWLRGRSATR